MSSREYNELMAEHYYTRAMLFALFAALMLRDYGLCPSFACMLLATISNVIGVIMYMRRANGRAND